METAKWMFQITTSNPNCARVQRLERKWEKALEWYGVEKYMAEKGETIALERQLYVKNAYDEWEPANGLDVKENYVIYQWTKK